MKIYSIIIISTMVLSVLSATPLIYGQEEKPFIYNDEGIVDPFAPLITKDGKPVISYLVIKSVTDIVVEGIIYDPAGGSVVVMNSLVFKENDRAGKLTVKKIKPYSVVIDFNGKEYEFKLKE